LLEFISATNHIEIIKISSKLSAKFGKSHQPLRSKHDMTQHLEQPFYTKRTYVDSRPALTTGSLNWIIFNLRAELEKAGAIAYIGSKILITPKMDHFILAGGTKQIGGCKK